MLRVNNNCNSQSCIAIGMLSSGYGGDFEGTLNSSATDLSRRRSCGYTEKVPKASVEFSNKVVTDVEIIKRLGYSTANGSYGLSISFTSEQCTSCLIHEAAFKIIGSAYICSSRKIFLLPLLVRCHLELSD